MRPPNPRKRQQGIALVTAMLVVAIVATIAAYLGLGLQVWLRQSQNVADRAQAEALREGALNWVSLILARDAAANNVDHLGEIWATNIPPLPTDTGLISISISDAQGRFNLNNLLRNGQPSPADIGVFQRLLVSVGLDPALTEALVDWMDADSQVRPGGAEDTEYLGLPHPYRAANQPLTSVDELRLVRGFSADAVARLRPYVVALPEVTPINVNTAPDSVLAALFTALPASALQPFLQTRQQQPLTDPGQFMSRLPAGLAPPQAAYSVNTSYFLVNIDIRVGRLERRSQALIHRPAGGKPANLVWQSQQYVEPMTKNESST